MKERIVSPSKEYNPVLISKIKNPAIVINRSESIRAGPILKLEYFFKIIAIISVPPLELPMLNKMAEPRAGSAIAKQSSSIGWSVKNNHSDHQKRHTGNKVEITGCHKSCLCNKNSKTGDTAEGKVIRELEKVGTNRHDQCADCQ